MPTEYLDEAKKILSERGEMYGGIEENFTLTAKLATLKLGKEISPYDVTIIMESVKDARRAYDPLNEDSHVDGINYRAFAAMFALK